MKKGFKFSVPQTKEHRENISKVVKKAWEGNDERKRNLSNHMKGLWARIHSTN